MRSISRPWVVFNRACQRGEVFARPNSNEPPAGFGDAPPRVSNMSNLASSAATARVPDGTVRLVAALTVLSWFGMIIHDRISLPELSLLSPDVFLPMSYSSLSSSRGGRGPGGCPSACCSAGRCSISRWGGCCRSSRGRSCRSSRSRRSSTTSLTPCTPDVSCHCSSFSFDIAQCEPGEFHGIGERARVLDQLAGDRVGDVRVDVRSVVKPELADQLDGRRRVLEGHEVGRIGDDRH